MADLLMLSACGAGSSGSGRDTRQLVKLETPASSPSSSPSPAAAPMRRGTPGYRKGLDRDGDGPTYVGISIRAASWAWASQLAGVPRHRR